MNPQALEICQKYHNQLVEYYNTNSCPTLSNADLEPLREAHILIYNNGFSLCCPGPIKNGLRNLSSEYNKYLNG